jgi:hypothetical protein
VMGKCLLRLPSACTTQFSQVVTESHSVWRNCHMPTIPLM